MPRRGENIHKRKDGRWEARYILDYNENGKARYKSIYGKTYNQVKEKLKQTQGKSVGEVAFNNMTIQQVSEEWLAYSKMRVKESTFARYYDIVHLHVLPRIGNIKLKKLNNAIINNYIQYLSTNGRKDCKGGLEPKTVKDIVSILKQILAYAKRNGYFSGFEYCLSIPKNQQDEITVFTELEQQIIIEHIRNNVKERTNYLGFLVALFTGIRLGELCALQWSDVNLQQGVIRITKTLQRIKNTDIDAKTKTKIIITEPKSRKSRRTIPLPDFLVKILKKYEMSNKIYILTGSMCFLEPRTYENQFKRFLECCQVDFNKFHALRHTFATNLIKAGVDIKTVSELLGHSSVKITLDLYVHSDMITSY